MSVYNINIPPADIDIANHPEIGGESKVRASYEEIAKWGTINQLAPASGTATLETPAMEFGTGVNLVARAENGLVSSQALVITLGVTFADNTSGTATATFQPPSFAKDQSFNMPIGLAVDVIGVGAGNENKKIKAITGIASIAGGARGNKIGIYALPDIESYFDVGCARNKDETLPIPKALAIPCGLQGSAFTKLGRGDAGSLQLQALNFSYGDGLARFNGHRVTVLLDVMKDDRVLSERTVYAGYVGTANTPRGDGDDEVVVTVDGMFETFFKFV